MKKELIALYKELLFNVPQTTLTLKTYVIVDSIRDEKVKEKILFSELNHVDLWHEELFENEQDVPLYLVELEKENELLDYLLTQHTKSIATYFISPYSLETLQTYYSMFTHVNIEVEENNINKGIFGFYDPNILSNYIQTLYTPEKVDEFFAGAAMWLSPSVDIETELYIAFRDKEGEIDDVTLDLETLLQEDNPIFNFDNASLPTLPNLEAYAHEVNIDHTQVKMFDDVEKVKFIDDIFEEYLQKGYNFYINEQRDKKRALLAYNEAENLGVSTEGGYYKYILLSLFLPKPISELNLYNNLIEQPNEETKIKLIEQAIDEVKQRGVAHGN
jgi:hypothetical protein